MIRNHVVSASPQKNPQGSCQGGIFSSNALGAAESVRVGGDSGLTGNSRDVQGGHLLLKANRKGFESWFFPAWCVNLSETQSPHLYNEVMVPM